MQEEDGCYLHIRTPQLAIHCSNSLNVIRRVSNQGLRGVQLDEEEMAESIQVSGLTHGDNPIPTASRRGKYVMTSAVLGLDRVTRTIAEAPEEQCRLVFENLGAILQECGMDWSHVLKLTFYVDPTMSKQPINDQWLRLYPDTAARPARHIIVSQTLPGKVKIQCEAFAVGD